MKTELSGVLRVALVSLLFGSPSSLFSNDYHVYNFGNRFLEKHDDRYFDTIQPVLNRYCVGCHSCNSGPCQLNLTSFEGVLRGLSKDSPHDADRTFKAIDWSTLDHNLSVIQWREKGFYPIINQSQDPELVQSSILFQALILGKNSPVTSNDLGRREAIRHEQDRFNCPIDKNEFNSYRAKHPHGGMPLALAPMTDVDYTTLMEWMVDGSPGPTREAKRQISKPSFINGRPKAPLQEKFESFLSSSELRSQAVARYLFEHTYTWNIHFKDNPGDFYRIIRSKTPFPEDIQRIRSEFVTDDPQYKGRIHYRLEKLTRAIELKKHPLWDFSKEDLDFLKSSFLDTDWSIESLPAYTENPFEWFQVIPVEARASFAVRYGKEIWRSVARGSICHSRESSYLEPDYGWYFMLKPSADPTVQIPRLGLSDYDVFYSSPDDAIPMLYSGSFKDEPHEYQRAFENSLRQLHPKGLSLDHIEDRFFYGIRHETSHDFYWADEDVVPGYPRFKRILSYADTERYYYRTVVEFRHHGSATEKIETFSFASYIRGFSEDLFTSLHPDETVRAGLRDWTNHWLGRIYYGLFEDYGEGRPSQIENLSYEEMSLKLLERLRPIDTSVDQLNNWPLKDLSKVIAPEITDLNAWESGIRTLTGREASYARFVPNTVYIRLGGEHLYTFFVERAYNNDRILLNQARARIPEKDRLFAKKGFTGAFPHLFVDLEFRQASAFLEDLGKVSNIEQWIAFDHKYGIDRMDPEFWPFNHWLHDWISENMGAEGGILDLRNYDLRDLPY